MLLEQDSYIGWSYYLPKILLRVKGGIISTGINWDCFRQRRLCVLTHHHSDFLNPFPFQAAYKRISFNNIKYSLRWLLVTTDFSLRIFSEIFQHILLTWDPTQLPDWPFFNLSLPAIHWMPGVSQEPETWIYRRDLVLAECMLNYVNSPNPHKTREELTLLD